ncbi:unnamed protein product [Urochloa humidicola]
MGWDVGWAARFLTAGVLFAPDALRLAGSGDGATAAAAARLVHLLAFATAWALGHLRRRHRHIQVSRRHRRRFIRPVGSLLAPFGEGQSISPPPPLTGRSSCPRL